MLAQDTLDALAESRRRIDHLLQGVGDDILAAWLNALAEVQALLADALDADEYEITARLEAARQAIAEHIAAATQTGSDVLTAQARTWVETADATQQTLITTQLPPATTAMRLVDKTALAEIIARTTQQVAVRHWRLTQDATNAMWTALRTGIAAGRNPRDVAARILNGTQDVFTGGITRAMTIARTEMLDAYRAATTATQQANRDILAGWIWWATLDGRTCPSCIAHHGETHPVDDPGPHDHHQGRCVALPKTRTWAELGFDLPEPDSLDVETGPDWFSRQPEQVQRDILGPRRYSAWRAGQYPVEEWSEIRHSEGWRDAYHLSPAPQEPAGGWKWPVPDDPPSPHEAAHFLARQNQLPFDFAGETLKPREVVFAERMHELGETIRWIPAPPAIRGRGLPPSGGFEWRGKKYELKSPKPDADAITARIRKAVDKSRKWGPDHRKERFLIHLPGGAPAKLLDELAEYNLKASALDVDLSIRELWVLSDRLRRIRLKR